MLCSLAGYDENSVLTYAMLVGVVTSGEALGEMLGSPISSAVTEQNTSASSGLQR